MNYGNNYLFNNSYINYLINNKYFYIIHESDFILNHNLHLIIIENTNE